MKIGIVTFWNSEDNYGQILQCYALQRFLRDKGHDAFLIRYAPGRKINLKWVLSLPCRIVRKISLRLFRRKEFRFSQRFKEMNRIVRQENAAHPRHFSTFKERFIAVTSRVYDQYDIFTDPPGADAYIAGSDQVWGSVDPVYYLMFVPEGCKKIAYAPSFGGMKLAGSLRVRRTGIAGATGRGNMQGVGTQRRFIGTRSYFAVVRARLFVDSRPVPIFAGLPAALPARQ